jgi:AsmA protein
LPKGASLSAGTLNADLNVTGPTNKLVIAGTVGLFNGVLAGFDLGSKMSTVASLAGIKTGKDLNIEKVTSNLRVATTGIQADNFLAVLPTIGNLAGAGTVDSKNNLDFKMLATLTKEASSAAGSAGGAGSAAGALGGILGAVTGGGSGGSEGLKIPFQIQGTTSDPKFIPDIGGLAKDLFKSQLGNLGGKSSPGATKAQNPADALSNLGGLFKKKKP